MSARSTRWSARRGGGTIAGMAVHIDASLPVHPLTVDDIRAMLDAGILAGDDKVELLDGVLVEMSPQGEQHLAAVTRLNMLVVPIAIATGHVVTPQCPLDVVSPISLPEPDIAVVPVVGWDAYPGAAVLVVEVSMTSRAVDLGRKAAIYAAAGIPEYWVLDLADRRLVVHRDPAGDGYTHVTRLTDADAVTATRLPLTVAVADLLPPQS